MSRDVFSAKFNEFNVQLHGPKIYVNVGFWHSAITDQYLEPYFII